MPEGKNKLTPLKAVRRHCVDICMGGSYSLVPECEHKKCPLHELRHGKSVKGVQPLKQIRKKCIECVDGAKKVRGCNGDKLLCGPCPLYAFRNGSKPKSSRVGTK